MDFFKWKDSYNIGIEELDRQHRYFLKLLNTCYTKMSASKQKAIDPAMTARLREYATLHFHFEEELMRFKSYPDMLRQQEQHIIFEKMILDLEAGCAGGRDRSIDNVFTFLRDWFLKHILEEDKKIALFIK